MLEAKTQAYSRLMGKTLRVIAAGLQEVAATETVVHQGQPELSTVSLRSAL